MKEKIKEIVIVAIAVAITMAVLTWWHSHSYHVVGREHPPVQLHK